MSPGSPLVIPRTLIVGRLYAEARRSAGLSQAAAAVVVGMPQSAVARLEAGHTRASLDHILRVGGQFPGRDFIADVVAVAGRLQQAGHTVTHGRVRGAVDVRMQMLIDAHVMLYRHEQAR